MPKGGYTGGERVGCASEFGRESACVHRAAYATGAGRHAVRVMP